MVHSLYAEIGEGLGAKIVGAEDKILMNTVSKSKPQIRYILRYNPSKLGFQPVSEFIPKQDTWGELQYLGLKRSKWNS